MINELFKRMMKNYEYNENDYQEFLTFYRDNQKYSKVYPEVVSSLDSLSKQDIINFEELQNLLEKSNNPLVFDAVRNFFELYTYQRVKVQPLESFYKIRSAVAKFGTEKDIVDFGKLDSSLEQNSEFLNKVISMGIIQSEKPKVKELVDN